jgi:hypothetical protein
MANRLIQNVIIVDSAMGNNYIIDPNSGGSTVDGKVYPRNLLVNAFLLSGADTSGVFAFTDANTANVLIQLDRFNTLVHFAAPQKFANLKCVTASAGTAWIYLA